MNLNQINVVGLQTTQRFFEFVEHTFAATAVYLGCQEDLVAARAHYFADDRLAAIIRRSIEIGNTAINSVVQTAHTLRMRNILLFAQRSRSITDKRNLHAVEPKKRAGLRVADIAFPFTRGRVVREFGNASQTQMKCRLTKQKNSAQR
jgi:hypothetical protein